MNQWQPQPQLAMLWRCTYIQHHQTHGQGDLLRMFCALVLHYEIFLRIYLADLLFVLSKDICV
jgi:hypothetical protein